MHFICYSKSAIKRLFVIWITFIVMRALNINQYINQIFTKHKKRSNKIFELKNQLLKEFREQNHSKVNFRIEFALFGVEKIGVEPVPKVMWSSTAFYFSNTRSLIEEYSRIFKVTPEYWRVFTYLKWLIHSTKFIYENKIYDQMFIIKKVEFSLLVNLLFLAIQEWMSVGFWTNRYRSTPTSIVHLFGPKVSFKWMNWVTISRALKISISSLCKFVWSLHLVQHF